MCHARTNATPRCTPGGIGHALALEFHEKGQSPPDLLRPLFRRFFLSLFLLSSCEKDLETNASAGLHVIATARNPNVLEGLGQLGMTTLQLDVTKPESIARCRDDVSALTGGRLEILVNNASVLSLSLSLPPRLFHEKSRHS